MNKKEIEVILQQRLPKGKTICLKENKIQDGRNASWGNYTFTQTGIDYYIYPHVLIESFPGAIQYDHSEKGSGVQVVIEEGQLKLAKAPDGVWYISYNNGYSSIVEHTTSSFSKAVYLMNDWLEKNKENYKVIDDTRSNH